MEEEGPPAKKPAAGAPLWMATFADLMSLLLAFFVLLFSFSEMDKQKFKELAGSLKNAFGVQTEVYTRNTPKGTSIIAREFSPGRTDPTALPEVRQHTTDDLKRYADVNSADGTTEGQLGPGQAEASPEFEADLSRVEEYLHAEVDTGLLEIQDDGQQVIVIRIKEKGSFPSGSADLKAGFDPVVAKIASLVNEIPGSIVVAGHSDNRPISTARFRSNWELSAGRAATVLHRILDESGADPTRFRLAGHAETRPLSNEDTDEARTANRRVEVILLRGAAHEPEPGALTGSEQVSMEDEDPDAAAVREAQLGLKAELPADAADVSADDIER